MTAQRWDVVVAEDDPDLRAILASAVGCVGFSVVTAADVGEAERWVYRGRPQILLLDLLLDGGGAVELLRRVRLHETGRRVSVILTSGMGNLTPQALKLGVTGVLRKPFGLGDLRAALAPWRGRLATGSTLPVDLAP